MRLLVLDSDGAGQAWHEMPLGESIPDGAGGDNSYLDGDWYIEGLVPGVVELELSAEFDGVRCFDRVTVVVYEILAVSWEAIHGTLHANSGPGGGLALYPDSVMPEEGQTHFRAWAVVRLVVLIDPPISGVKLWLSIVDVDDPSASAAPVDDENVECDNRDISSFMDITQPESPPFVHTLLGITNGSGQFSDVFYTGMQPGDNYRAIATALLSSSRYRAVPADATGRILDDAGFPPTDGATSDMLTIWRRLWLEVDSMTAENFSVDAREFSPSYEYLHGTVLEITTTTNDPTLSIVGADNLALAPDYRDQFEGGQMYDPATGAQWLIVRNTPVAGVFTVWGPPVPLTLLGARVELRDDDLRSPQLPQYTIVNEDMRGAYRAAYIDLIEYEQTAGQLQWTSHLSNTEIMLHYMGGVGTCGRRELTTRRDYWARLVVVAYQPDVSLDGDPDFYENAGYSVNLENQAPPYPTTGLSALLSPGSQFGITLTHPIRPTAASYIFVETIRDSAAIPMNARQWQFAAHEIGHGTWPRHGEEVEHGEDGLMVDMIQAADTQFRPETIARFRAVMRW